VGANYFPIPLHFFTSDFLSAGRYQSDKLTDCPKCHKPASAGPIEIRRAKSLWPWEKQEEGVSPYYLYDRWTHVVPKHIRPAVLTQKVDEILGYAQRDSGHANYRQEIVRRLEDLKRYSNRKTMRTYCYLRVADEKMVEDTPGPPADLVEIRN
jgi:hypothetical protein